MLLLSLKGLSALTAAGPPRPRLWVTVPHGYEPRGNFSILPTRRFVRMFRGSPRCAACLRVSALDCASGVKNRKLLSSRSPSRPKSNCRCSKRWSGMTSRIGLPGFLAVPSFALMLTRSVSTQMSLSASSWRSAPSRLKLSRQARRWRQVPMVQGQVGDRRLGFVTLSTPRLVLFPGFGAAPRLGLGWSPNALRSTCPPRPDPISRQLHIRLPGPDESTGRPRWPPTALR